MGMTRPLVQYSAAAHTHTTDGRTDHRRRIQKAKKEAKKEAKEEHPLNAIQPE